MDDQMQQGVCCRVSTTFTTKEKLNNIDFNVFTGRS